MLIDWVDVSVDLHSIIQQVGVGWCFASDQLMDNVDMEVLIRNTLCGSLRQKTKKYWS